MEIQRINSFFKCSKYAIVGVSSDINKTGNAIFRELKKQSYQVIPVSNKTNEVEGIECIASIADLPSDVDALIFTTKPNITDQLVKEAIEKGIKNFFFQLGSAHQETFEYAQRKEVNAIFNRCVFMFVNPKGIHKFHVVLAKLFRTYPN